MFELTFLGTSASVPSTDRNQSCLLVSAAGSRILVDCGEGAQRQLFRSGAGFRRLNRLLLTHGHLDHVLGIPGLLATMGLQRGSEELVIHGSPRTLQVVVNLLAGLWGDSHAPVPLALVPLVEAEAIVERGFSITPFPVRHRDTDSLGYIFEASPRRHLYKDRLNELKVPNGPLRKALAAGQSVTLSDGRLIEAEEVLGPVEAGSKLVVVGDVESIDGLERYVDGADLLVIEATFLQKDEVLARNYGHLTAAAGASLAASSHVSRLILTHISGRYLVDDILAEAKAIFPETQIANDFERFVI